MVTICLQCGVEGWDNAFVYCVKCLNEAVHRYCLDELPKTYDEFVRYVCDDCEAESQKITHSNSDDKTQERTSLKQIDVDSTITLNKKIISNLTERVENGHCENGAVLQSPHKELNSTKDSELVSQYRPSRAETNGNDDCSPMVLVENEPRCPVNSSPLHEEKKVEAVANGASTRAKLRKLNDFSLGVTTNQSRSSDSAVFDEDDPLASLSPMATNPENDISCTLDKFAEPRCENLPALQPHKDGQDTNKEKDAEILEELSSLSCDKNDVDGISQSPIKAQPIVAAGESCLRAKPLVDPIWRGNFIILNQDDTIEGLAAHLSSKACRMVFNEASLLQTSLHLKILPREVVWPKSFEKTEPTDDNIAMYILPTDSRYAKPFDLLVTKMTKQELAMKAITKNAELLIFTSTELPLSYWKFGEKCYLWGVFLGKQSLLSSRAAGDPVVPI